MNLSVSKRYAKALMQIALQENQIALYKNQFQEFALFIENSTKLQESFTHVHIKQKEKLNLLDSLLSKEDMQKNLSNFIKILIIKKRFNFLQSIYQLFEAMVNARLNIEKGHIISSQQMSDNEKQQLTKDLEEKLKKQVDLSYSQDASLISGIVARIGSIEVNASVSNRLNLLYNKIITN